SDLTADPSRTGLLVFFTLGCAFYLVDCLASFREYPELPWFETGIYTGGPMGRSCDRCGDDWCVWIAGLRKRRCPMRDWSPPARSRVQTTKPASQSRDRLRSAPERKFTSVCVDRTAELSSWLTAKSNS